MSAWLDPQRVVAGGLLAILALLPVYAALTLAPALSSMSIYMLMAAILVVRPEGLFPAASR